LPRPARKYVGLPRWFWGSYTLSAVRAKSIWAAHISVAVGLADCSGERWPILSIFSALSFRGQAGERESRQVRPLAFKKISLIIICLGISQIPVRLFERVRQTELQCVTHSCAFPSLNPVLNPVSKCPLYLARCVGLAMQRRHLRRNFCANCDSPGWSFREASGRNSTAYQKTKRSSIVADSSAAAGRNTFHILHTCLSRAPVRVRSLSFSFGQ